MSDTTNYFFNRPTVGGSEDTWGADLNENWAKLDALLHGVSYTDGDANTVERIRPDLSGNNWAVEGVAITATGTEINYLDGVTSGIQAQLNAKQASDATLTALAGVTFTPNTMLYATGADAFATASLTAYARTLLDDASATVARGTLGIGDGFQDVAIAADASDLDDVAESGLYSADGSSVSNVPGTANVHAVVHVEITNSGLAMQQAVDLSTNYLYQRVRAGGNWAAWQNMTPLGVGQVPTDMTGSRVLATSYQNTTGRPMWVNIADIGTTPMVQLSSNNSTWVDVGRLQGDATPTTFLVPAGWYYRTDGGSGVVDIWVEWR